MTITAKNVRVRLAASSTLLDNLSTRLVVATTNATLAMSDPIPDDRPKVEDAGIRGKGGHGDPTADAALRGLAWDDRVFELMEANLDTLALALANLMTFADHWAPIAGDRTRCHGGRTVDEWSDPTCYNWAELTAAGNTRGDGLCAACRKRRDRWERRMAEREVA
jgi:hypothetical protein